MLATQDTTIRLTIDPDPATPLTRAELGKEQKSATAVGVNTNCPPLECCIRTKWEGARVDWNDTEPLM